MVRSVALLACAIAAVAADLTPVQKNLQDALRGRRQENSGGSIRTSDGNVIITVGEGNTVNIQIGDDEPINLATLPQEVNDYSDSNLNSFATGFQTCRTNDNSGALLDFMNTTFLANERTSTDALNSAVIEMLANFTDMRNELANNQSSFSETFNTQLTTANRNTAAVQTALGSLVGNSSGLTPTDASTSCSAIRAAHPSSQNGVYYLKHPEQESWYPRQLWGMWADNKFVLKVYCNFETGWVYNGTEGGLFRIDYHDGMKQPTQVVAPRLTQWYIRAFGAAGGDDFRTSRRGGQGGRAWGMRTFTDKTTMYFYPGGKGGMSSYEDNAQYDDIPDGVFHKGGWNGGGRGTRGGSGGGGASDVRLIPQREVDKIFNRISLASRILVAGGGGGCGYGQCTRVGGYGGITGGSGTGSGTSRGGTQSSGGTNSNGRTRAYGRLGYGGNVDTSYSYNDGGGGGGGYYGGSGASTTNTAGGGGSSYIRGLQSAGAANGGSSGHGFIEFRWREL